MSAANGHNARSAFAAAVIGQFIHHRVPGTDEWSQQGTVQPEDPVRDQPDSNPAKDQDAQHARQKAQGGIEQDGQKKIIAGIVCDRGRAEKGPAPHPEW